MNQPSYSDLVMGGQTPNLRGSLVLGGIDGIKKQLASNSELQRCEALYQAVKYGEKGKAVIVAKTFTVDAETIITGKW